MQRLYMSIHRPDGVMLHGESVDITELKKFDMAYRPPIEIKDTTVEIRLSIREVEE